MTPKSPGPSGSVPSSLSGSESPSVLPAIIQAAFLSVSSQNDLNSSGGIKSMRYRGSFNLTWVIGNGFAHGVNYKIFKSMYTCKINI